jgi:hypothetical protein
VKQLIITVESGHGNNTTPLVLLESSVKGEVRLSRIPIWLLLEKDLFKILMQRGKKIIFAIDN